MAAGLGALMAMLGTDARAQSVSPFQPTLQDPRSPQRFGTQPDKTQSVRTLTTTPSAGDSGFESTTAAGKRKKRLRPGERNVGLKSIATQSVPPVRGLSQQAANRPTAPQLAARAVYADAYKPADEPGRARRGATAADPFEPVGIRVDDFVLRPSIEVSTGYDTNPSRRPDGRASQFTVLTPELQAKSDWSRHELSVALRGSYSRYEADSFLNRPSLDAKVTGRIDVTRDTRIDLETRAIVGTDNPGSPNVVSSAGLSQLPVYTSIGATAGVAHRMNRLELSTKVLADRTVFQDSKLTDGTTFSNDDRAYNQFGAQARAAYEFSPGFKPFVEIAGDRRMHDVRFDRNGVQRDSTGLTPRVGAAFEVTRLITGELSVGYVNRSYKDPNLKPLSGIVADGTLTYAATGLTTATLTASSRAEESILPGVSGALKRDAGLQVDHAFRRWLIGTARIGYGKDEYVGLGRDDTRTSLGLALTYKFNRDLSMKGEFRQEWLHSNVPGVNYDASIFTIGIKAQR